MEKSSIRARVYSDGEKSSANENKVFAVTVTKTSKVLPKKDFEWKCGRGEVASSQADISLLSTTPNLSNFSINRSSKELFTPLGALNHVNPANPINKHSKYRIFTMEC